MPDELSNQIVRYLEKNLADAINIIAGKKNLDAALQQLIAAKRDSFLEELNDKVQERIVSLPEVNEIGVNDKGEKIYQYHDVSFTLYMDQAYPGHEAGGSGMWWGIYDEMGKEHRVSGLDNGHWESVRIGDTKDFQDSDEGSLKILAVANDQAGRSALIDEISNGIIRRVEELVLPSFDQK